MFEQAAETPQNTTQQRRQPAAPVQAGGTATEENSWPEFDRRQKDGRRRADRREKQQAILLNTRKLQGRRKDPGRRREDKLAAPNSRIHFSIKG